MSSVERSLESVKLGEFIRDLGRRARAASVAEKQALLQKLIDGCSRLALGRGRGEPKPSPALSSRWQCSRCGTERAAEFNYSGCYERTVVFSDGEAIVRIPRVRCRCGGNVRPDFGAGLPRRKRLWYDVRSETVSLHVEGCSYRGISRVFAHRGVAVGPTSLAGQLREFAAVDINAGVMGDSARALSLDGAFFRLGTQSRAQLYVHEVLAREKPLVRAGKPVAWYRTGKVLSCILAAEESLAGWEAALEETVSAGWVDAQAPVWVVSDGNRGLLSAVDMQLPWSIRQRCTWHIGYRARNRVITADKDEFEHSVLRVFNAPDVVSACGRLDSFVKRWGDTEPEAVKSVLEKFEQGIEYLKHSERKLRPRTVGISERYNQEVKRLLKPMRAFGNEQNMLATTRLIALRHNCILDHIDWLTHAIDSVWNQPLLPSIAVQQQHQQQSPTTPPYTIGGT